MERMYQPWFGYSSLRGTSPRQAGRDRLDPGPLPRLRTVSPFI